MQLNFFSSHRHQAHDPEVCQRIVSLAKPHFLTLIGRANEGLELEDRDRMTILYFLEALLTLQHLQRPAVIQNMTVSLIKAIVFYTKCCN